MHFLHGARQLANLDLSDAEDLDVLLDRIARFAADHREHDWIVGHGWFYAVFPGGMPHRHLLDRIVPDRPVVLEAYDSHTSWVNTSALHRLAITRTSPDPPRGEIDRDSDGEATGILKEGAMDLVSRALPEPTPDQDLASLVEAVRLAHRRGITSVQDAGASREQFALFRKLQESGKAMVRIRLATRLEPGRSMSDVEKQLVDDRAAVETWGIDHWVSGGIVKAFADGVIESGTAAMLAPYEGMTASQSGALGHPYWDWNELAEAVALADAWGWQVQIHAIGDGAVRAVLDAYAHAATVNPPWDRRHRIEHIETVDARDIPRFGQQQVTASMQPYHADPHPPELELYTSKIGADRASRGWPWASIRRAGGRLAFGSDWPVVSSDPLLGLNSAVNRTTRDGRPSGGWLPWERLSLGEALAAYTTGAAFAERADSPKGSLLPGMLADIVILDADLTSMPTAEIVNAKVQATICGGRPVFENQAS